MSTSTARARQLLAGAARALPGKRAVVGLDGFVDSIIRVVGRRDSQGGREFIPDIAAFAQRIGNAAGKSTAMELIVQQTKLGGNGPIMANALAALGLKLTYIGAVGAERGLHPVFQPMADRGTVFPVCPAACTDALEFHDGKIMFQRMECLDHLDFAAIRHAVGPDRLVALLDDADFVALNHWASLPHMTAIWQALQDQVCPRLAARPRQIFFDLADTEKRSAEDIRAALRTAAGFTRWYEASLGLNEKESEHIAQVLGCEPSEADPRQRVLRRAEAIQRATGLSTVAVHPLKFAAAASADASALVDGPYTAKPLISTGAGDHFNAGYCLGRILGGDLEQSLELGVVASGFYVRSGESPSVERLEAHLVQWQAEKAGKSA